MAKQYQNIINDYTKEKIKTKNQIMAEISRNKSNLQYEVREWMYAEEPNIQQLLNDSIEKRNQHIHQKLVNMMESFYVTIEHDIDQLKEDFSLKEIKNKVSADNIDIDKKADSDSLSITKSDEASNFNIKQIAKPELMLSLHAVKPEHIVKGLQTLQSTFPSLMKNISLATMEKWAGKIVGRYIPVVGTIVTIGSTINDLFGEDEQTRQLKSEIKKQQEAIERRDKQISDAANNIADNFEIALNSELIKMIDDFFDKVISQLKNVSDQFNENDQKNIEYNQQLSEIRQIAGIN